MRACRVGLLVGALTLTGTRSSFAGSHVPSPTPRPTSSAELATPTATPLCDVPSSVPQALPSTVRSGELVTLDANASSGAITALRWAQSAGPRVAIASGDSPLASFVAPPVAVPTVVTIALAVFSSCTPPVVVATVDVTILPPPGVALIAVQDMRLVTGEPTNIDVRLHTDQNVSRVEHDLRLGPAIAFVASSDGRPQCVAPAEIGASAQIEFSPLGCVADGCTGIHFAVNRSEPIPDGALLYSCAIAAAGDSPTSCEYPYDCCDHLLACDDPSAAGVDGTPLPAQCVQGRVRILFPPPAATFVFTVDPPQPRVGDLVSVSVETVRESGGLIGIPVYSLRGTQPFLTGDVSPRHLSGPGRVSYLLQAVRAGTAGLSIDVAFETEQGCPGNEFYAFDGLQSGSFPLTIAAAACDGDCDADGRVAVHELVIGVRMALGDAGLAACPAMDGNGSGGIQVDDLVAAVTATLLGCAE